MITKGLQFLKYPLSQHAVHVDFLRLRCGSEAKFARGISKVREQSGQRIHTFISFSEWDAVLVVPSAELYPRTLTEIYANDEVAASVSGTSGYFAYVWEHPVNYFWREHLARFEARGPAILMSLRFADWLRRDAGLGSEILFCDYLEKLLKTYSGLGVVVAHSLGWNDVILLMHADNDEARLTKLLATIRLTTLGDCIGSRSAMKLGFSQNTDAQIFAASYSHLLGGFNSFRSNSLSLGTLASQIKSARLLIRIAPPQERNLRKFLDEESARVGARGVTSEMGHYSLSIDISKIINRRDEGKEALAFIAATRSAIGRVSRGKPDSYAETTTIFRFREPKGVRRPPTATKRPSELEAEILAVEKTMRELPHQLRQLGASSMTVHRFVSVLTTLLDHLSDPVRSSVVRHLGRFASQLKGLVTELEDNDAIDDLCHVLEYAVGQAIDGIAQFQHDANALGLSGRGGYSRLIVTVEWYIRAMFAYLGITIPVPLITFGLRSGNAGSTGRYQIDIPFNVLFNPSRWHVLLHEIGHMAWTHTFGWMMESLAIYTAMEKEIRLEVLREIRSQPSKRSAPSPAAVAAERVHIQFLRSREIVRELFPSYLTFALPCDGKIDELDGLAFRRMFTMGHPSSLTRELLLRVVTHCLLVIISDAMSKDLPPSSDRHSNVEEEAAAWWSIWDPLRNQSHDSRIQTAINAISNTMAQVDEEARNAEMREKRSQSSPWVRTPRINRRLSAKMQILHSELFNHNVSEALQSVVELLSQRANLFRRLDPGHVGPSLFGELLKDISDIQHDQSDPAYAEWIGVRFAGWIHEGKVLTRYREPFIWSRLLLGSRQQLVEGPEGSFMRSQLSVLLSMWHGAITKRPKPNSTDEGILKSLGLVLE